MRSGVPYSGYDHVGPCPLPYNDRLTHPEPDNALEAFLDQHFDDQRMEKVYPNAKVQGADGTWEKMNEMNK